MLCRHLYEFHLLYNRNWRFYWNQQNLVISSIRVYCILTHQLNNSKLNIEYSVSTIRKFMKSKMNISFKRVKSRPVNIKFKKIERIRSIFVLKLSQEIVYHTLLINIDESSINRFVKTNYYWGYKWKPFEWKNSSFTGSISWVLAVCSNGSWLSFLTNQTFDSRNFIWFIKILNNRLNLYENVEYNEVIIILDNWSAHKSQLTQNLLNHIMYFIFWFIILSLFLVEMSLIL